MLILAMSIPCPLEFLFLSPINIDNKITSKFIQDNSKPIFLLHTSHYEDDNDQNQEQTHFKALDFIPLHLKYNQYITNLDFIPLQQNIINIFYTNRQFRKPNSQTFNQTMTKIFVIMLVILVCCESLLTCPLYLNSSATKWNQWNQQVALNNGKTCTGVVPPTLNFTRFNTSNMTLLAVRSNQYRYTLNMDKNCQVFCGPLSYLAQITVIVNSVPTSVMVCQRDMNYWGSIKSPLYQYTNFCLPTFGQKAVKSTACNAIFYGLPLVNVAGCNNDIKLIRGTKYNNMTINCCYDNMNTNVGVTVDLTDINVKNSPTNLFFTENKF